MTKRLAALLLLTGFFPSQPKVSFAQTWIDRADQIEKSQGRPARDRILQQCEARLLDNRSQNMDDCLNQLSGNHGYSDQDVRWMKEHGTSPLEMRAIEKLCGDDCK